ncbi:alpha/beta fold hydrolase [Nostocoides sp. HKS02]|uniref:alpha/beta fold hydrolase n=1 Tax=Nostocoides sp. HKS02 TaxID=1813880 RepID=UPI0012B469F8|nr:alpha/beta hydrolase [Tetrasphaera sp. HKS02]QGN56849.1 alpha/beta fold hydrolase [Tetrasphaera sp. HKS02]
MPTVTATTSTRFVTSADGTAIAYDVTGTGPAVVVVEGALCQRTMGTAKALLPLLSESFAVFAYDRRGRGESGAGSSAYAVQREVEDLVAVLEVAGPDACVVGASSGAVLVLEALRAGVSVRKAALYEAPFIVDGTHAPNDSDLGARTQQLVDAGRHGDAVKLFMRTVGVPAFGVVMMRVMPVWKKLCAVAHTLPHDYALVLEHQQGAPLPAGYLSAVTVPVLVIVGGKSPAYMKNAQAAIAAALPNGTLRELPGQTHLVRGKATVPVLRDFWSS